MDPIDYTSGFASVPSPQTSFLQGVQGGAAISQMQFERQQQQAALAQQAQKKAVLTDLVSKGPNATADDYVKAGLQVPELSAQFKQFWDMKNEAQQQGELQRISGWAAAIDSGQPKIASDAMRAQADAIENTAGAPTQESKGLRAKADQVDANPQASNVILKSMLAANPKGKAAIDSIVALGKEKRDADLAPAALREANAKASGTESDVSLKNLGIVAQKAGALAKPGVKPAQAQTMFRTLAAQGLIPKDDLQGYIDGIPTDPKDLPDYLKQVQASGMTSKEQMAYTTPDANAKLSAATQVQTTGMNNATSIKTTSMNNAAQVAVQDKITARQDAKGEAEANLDGETLTTMAQQYLAGDKSVMQNLGRGAQGAANIVALRKEITTQAKAKGMSGPQIAAQMADYAGMTAGIRTSATISARVENAISEAKELAPLAIAAGREVSRSGFLPFGKAGVMFDTQTNNPALKKFVTANNGLVSAYAGAMARGQKPTVSDYDHAREILAAAQSQPAYEATVNQMFAEMAAASKAPQNVRAHLRGEIGGDHGATTAPSIPAGWSVREH